MFFPSKLSEFEIEISQAKHDPKRKKTKIEGFDIQRKALAQI